MTKKSSKKVTKEAIELIKKLGDMPANVLTPGKLVEQARNLHEKISVSALGEEELKEMGANLLLSVGAGSAEKSYMIIMKYEGASHREDPVVLVGKGVTFDTGGISLKPSRDMHHMKYDMLGAATVMAAIQACAKLNLPIDVIAVVPTVENMPSSTATKPGDVFTSLSGLTVEVLNTDAEGRLILADALTYVDKFNPKVVIDVATLTGAALYALGSYATAVLGNDQELIDNLIHAGKTTEDYGWQLPLWEEHSEEVKGQKGVADLKNIPSKPGPGTTTAAAFLWEFADEYSWAHLDIAATASNGNKVTGRSVGMLIEYIISESKKCQEKKI